MKSHSRYASGYFPRPDASTAKTPGRRSQETAFRYPPEQRDRPQDGREEDHLADFLAQGERGDSLDRLEIPAEVLVGPGRKRRDRERPEVDEEFGLGGPPQGHDVERREAQHPDSAYRRARREAGPVPPPETHP